MTVQSTDWGELEGDPARVRASVSDVRPRSLRDRVDRRLRDATMTPGALVRHSARLVGRDAPSAELDRCVVGVQLIYEGLALTRALARDPPWEGEAGCGAERVSDADLEVIVANVLVARGISVLARTAVSADAVETVRAFGREETKDRVGRSDAVRPVRSLEAAVFELSIVAGVTATGAARPAKTREAATKLAESLEPGGGERCGSGAAFDDIETLVAETIENGDPP